MAGRPILGRILIDLGLSRTPLGVIAIFAAAINGVVGWLLLAMVIVLNVGLDLGVISPRMFTMLVLMAIFSTIMTTPLLRFWMPRAGFAVPGAKGGRPFDDVARPAA